MYRRTLALVVLAAVAIAGCSVINRDNTTTRIGSPPYTVGSGKSATDVRTLDQFHAISANNGVYVVVASGTARSAKVTLDDNLLSTVKTVVENGTLSIRVDGNIETRLRLEVTVTTPDSVDTLAVANGSTLDMESVNGLLSATVGNGSTLRGGGTATTLSLTVLTGSTGDLRNVTSENATVNVSGGSTAHIKATKSATGTCTGGSTTIVHGNTPARSISADNSSTVKTE